jgi:DNA-binding transcriptional LysR family regulator
LSGAAFPWNNGKYLGHYGCGSTAFFPGELDSGEVDCGVSFVCTTTNGVRSRVIFRERFVCAVCRSNPAVGEALSLDTYLALDHLLVSPRGDADGKIDRLLAARDLRPVAVTVPHFLLVPRIFPGTRLIATVAARVVTGCEHPGLRVLSPPIEIEGFDVHVAWHRRRDNDPALGWLRTRIAAAGREVQTPGIGEGLEGQRASS